MRFYGIDLSEEDAVDSARFFGLAYRLPLYEGAMAARAEEEAEQAKKRQPKHLRDSEVEYVPDKALGMTDNLIEFK